MGVVSVWFGFRSAVRADDKRLQCVRNRDLFADWMRKIAAAVSLWLMVANDASASLLDWSAD